MLTGTNARILLPLILTSSALAVPVVVTNDAPVPVGVNEFRLSDVDPSYPNVAFLLDEGTYGGGQTGGFSRPAVVEGGTFCFTPGPGLLSTEVANVGLENAPAGMTVDGSVGSWMYTEPMCDVGSVLPIVQAYDYVDAACQSCVSETSVYADEGLLYIPFRWQDTGASQWSYGWVAFEVTREFVGTCMTSCPPETVDTYEVQFRWVAAGFETDPETGITIGGGLCRADFTFDAQLDFFDISEFLTQYSVGSVSADLNGDGFIDFFDISEFLTEYNGCEF